MITATLTTGEATIAEIAARRDMEKQRFILWQTYLAASNLYVAMLGKSALFTDTETDAQYETCRDLEDAHTALDAEYGRLYLTDGTEEA